MQKQSPTAPSPKAVIATVDVEGKPVKVELYSLMINIDEARVGQRLAAEAMGSIGTRPFQIGEVNGKPVVSRRIVPTKLF